MNKLLITTNVTYVGTNGTSGSKITIGVDNNTPDYIYLFDENDTNVPQSPRDGPFKVNGSGTLASSGPVSFTRAQYFESHTGAVLKSARATKLWYINGAIVDNGFERMTNEVAELDTETFIVKV